MTADRELEIALCVLDANPQLLEKWDAVKPYFPVSGVTEWL